MVTKSDINEAILIVSDSTEELGDLHYLLSKDFGKCLATDNEEKALQMFNEFNPSVLILAFDEIGKAESFYLSLYMKQTKIIRHQSLLLCKSSEQNKAYELCIKGTFDDYVSDRPLYDPFRLRLSVTQAINRRSKKLVSVLLHHKIEKMTMELISFDALFSKWLASGDAQKKETIGTFHKFTKKLGADLENLEENLIGKSSDISLNEIEKEKLGRQLEAFREESLEKGSQDVAKQINDINDNNLQEFEKLHKNSARTIQKKNEVTIMMIDDNDFYLDTIMKIVQDAGMKAVGISDGATALIKLQYTKPKLIFLDYRMPGMDGIDTLRKIRSNPATKSIPVIMLTGSSSRDLVNNCMRAGASGFMIKPGDRDSILGKIKQTLDKK